MKARVIPAFGVALGAAFLGGVLAAPGWAQSILFGPCVNDDMTPVSDPCFESIKWAGSTNGFVANVDEVVWSVTIRGSSPIKRKPDFAEGSIDDAVVVTASSGPNPSSTVSDGEVTTADGVGRYRYNIKVPIARQYEGTVSLTLGAFEDTSGNGITAGQTPRGENRTTFTVSNVHRTADLRTVRIANGLRVRWRAASSATAGYLVRWKEETGSFNQGEIVTGTSYDITSLTVGTTYTVRVDTRNTGQGPMGRNRIDGTGLEVTRRVLDQLADIPSTGSVDADSDSTSIGSPVLPENGENSYKIVSWTATGSGYGSYEVARGHSGGSVYIWRWFYRLNKDNEDVKSLAPGQTLTDTFTMEDNSEPPREATVTITITRSPPPAPPVKILPAWEGLLGSVKEDRGTGVVSGKAVHRYIPDPRAPDTSGLAVFEEGSTLGKYGSFSIETNGSWTYTLDNADPDTDGLRGGQTVFDSFLVFATTPLGNPFSEGTGAKRLAGSPVVITVRGTEDAPTICIKVGIDTPGHDDGCVDGDLDILATEDSPVTQLRGRAVATDPDSPDRSFIEIPSTTGTYGTFSLGADGFWVYTLDNADPDTNALGTGQAGREVFKIVTVDEAVQSKIRVGVWGANDPATFSGKLSGSVTEDVPFSYQICLRRNDPDSVCLEEDTINHGVITSGKVTVSDPDSNNASALKKRQGVQRGTYGSLLVNADQGYWLYTLNNDSSHVQGLTAGTTVIETFTILAADDTPATVTITITGAEDQLVIEGDLTGSVTEGGANTRASGTVRVSGNVSTDQFRARSNIRGSYGTFNIDARGNWTYDLNDGDLLREGGVEYESFQVESSLSNGATAEVLIKVTGSDVVGAITASVGAGAGSRTSGRLTGHQGFEIGAQTQRGDFGCLIIQGNGAWEYLVYDTAPSSDCQASPGTQTATAGDSESFDLLFSRARRVNVCSPDNSIGCVSIPESVRFIERTLTINIKSGIAAVFDASTLTGAITEDTATTSGTVQVTDADGDDNKFTAAGSSNPISGDYGSLTITEDGVWTYRLFNTLVAVQALGQGATLKDSLTIQAADGTEGTLVITITGVNDAATIGGTVHGSVTEDATNNVVSAIINVTDVDGDNTLEASTRTGTYGNFVVNSSGIWTYTLFNGRAATNALSGGQGVTDQHRVRASDGTVGPVITITITGANDAATFGGTVHGSVTEDARETMATGTITVTDVDGGNTLRVRNATLRFGRLVVNSNGSWTYTLDNSKADTNALRGGQTITDSTVVRASDGTRGPAIRITVTGADDQATIEGDLAGSVTEDAVKADDSPDNQATGTVTLSDVDGGSSLTAQTDAPGKYGTFSLNATSGVWTYSLDNSDADTNALRSGQTVNDETFTIAASDGASATVTISITGADDPSTIGGTLAGAVTEDATVTTAGGTASITSTDSTVTFTAQTDVDGKYGTFSLATTGVWTYSLDNSDTDTNALADGVEETDSFAIATSDGGTASVVITVTGADDQATIEGDLAGSVTEDAVKADNSPDNQATGTVTLSDVDGGSSFTVQTDVDGTYGTFSLATSGAWTYSLDNSDPDTNALRAGQTVNDETFDIAASDGAAATVRITITGANDAATFGGTVHGSVTEDATETMATGTITVTDVDGDNTLQARTVTGRYGDFVVNSNGSWTYTLVNSRAATNALRGGQTVSESIDVRASDGTVRPDLSITITGADDQATIGGDLAGSVTEDAVKADNSPDNQATGTVTLSDVDGGSSLTAQTDTAGKYGTFSLNATSGVWTYSLDNSDTDTNALRAGQTVDDETFTIAASDGASATVTLTITGADDPSIIGGTLAGAVTEDDPVTTAEGMASITDVDSTATFTAQTNASGRYGTFSLATTGDWTYSLDNSDTDTNALKEGVEMTDSFTIATSDSSTAAVVITVTGANDAARITGTLAGSVMEDGTLTASGSVTVTDVDGDNALKQQDDQTSSYGSLSVDHSAGSWAYTLDNDAKAVQDLTGGVTQDDTFTILAADDTPATVTITITGAIDPGDIAGASGSVTEDDTLKARARGRVMLDGVSDATFTAQTNVSGTYGTFNLEANGNWTYDLDNSRSATNALAGEAEVRDTLEIATADNSATAVLIITVTGNDDRSTIDAANLAGSVMEDGTGTASKTVKVTDVDTDPAPEIEERSGVSGTYGTFGITPAGVWTYTLDNDARAVQALGAGQTLTEAFKIETEDGAEAVVTITITGTDDPREIEGTVTGSVTEDDEEASSSRGRVTVTGGADATFAVKANPPQSQTYGTFTIQPDGNWTYTLNNRDPDTNALTQGATATETITIEALEGTTAVDDKDVTITITGANDAAVFGAAGLTGAITEDAVPNTTTGTATVTDVDGDNRFSTEVAPNDGTMLTTGTGSYGSLTLTSAGVWTYTLNNGNPDTNALTAGQEVTDSFTIKASDGTETAVTITVTGAADPGEIEGDVSGSVREAAGDEDDQAQDRAGGRVRVADDPAAEFTVQMDTATTYGTFSLTAEGVWTYRLNNDKANALGQGETATDTIPIEATASDNMRKTATVTITVMGSEVGGDLTGSIREGSPTPVGGKLTTEQDYEIVDVEDIRRGEFGCLRVRSDGSWTYWLYGTNRLCPRPIEALAQSGTVTVLAAEQARMDAFTIEVMRPDGTVIRVSLTITIEEAAAPVTRTVAVTGYLQGRAEVLLGKQPGLGGFLKDLRSGITSEGQVSVDVRDGALLGFDGSFVRDGFWGALSVARSEQGSGRTDQIFGTLGYHGQVADAAFVGLMLQFDQADGRLDAGLGSIDGQGWLFGPYFATQYQAQPQVSPLILEGRLLYGPTSNDVRFVDGGTGTFDTQRWLASFRLEGEVLLDYGDRAIRLIPHFDAGWVQDKVEAFTDSAGMQVYGQTVRFSEVALGSDIEVPVRFGQRDALITGGLSLVSAREQSQGQNARVSVSDTYGRLELGLGYRLANGIKLEFGGSYDDVEGTDSEGKFSLSFGLSNQF